MLSVKTYQFKTHCKGDFHTSKTANIILPYYVNTLTSTKSYSSSNASRMPVETNRGTEFEYYFRPY